MFKSKPRIEDGQVVGVSPDDLGQLVDDTKVQAAEQRLASGRRPLYKLKKQLDELDLMVKYPHLSRKERRRVASPPDPRNVPGAKVPRGKPRAS